MPDILSHTKQTLWLSSAVPYLPPFWPLKQTRWVRGRVAHSSLRIAEVLVVAAESVGWFGQAEGAHRPGRGWHSPNSGTRLRVSHLGFQMRLKSQGPFDCLLPVLLLFVLNNCFLKAQRDHWLVCWRYLWICSHNCECHALTGTRMMRLESSGTQCPRVTMKRQQLFCFSLLLERLFQADKANDLSLSVPEQSSCLSPYLNQSVVISVIKHIVGPLFHDVK